MYKEKGYEKGWPFHDALGRRELGAVVREVVFEYCDARRENARDAGGPDVVPGVPFFAQRLEERARVAERFFLWRVSVASFKFQELKHTCVRAEETQAINRVRCPVV